MYVMMAVIIILINSLKSSLFQWNLIDGATGQTGSHSDLSALSKEHTQVFTMSMWDIPRKFRYFIKYIPW